MELQTVREKSEEGQQILEGLWHFMGLFVSVAGGVTIVMVGTNCGKDLSRDLNDRSISSCFSSIFSIFFFKCSTSDFK